MEFQLDWYGFFDVMSELINVSRNELYIQKYFRSFKKHSRIYTRDQFV